MRVEEYIRLQLKTIELLRKSKGPIIIFGTGDLAKKAYLALAYYNIADRLLCFVDNNSEKQMSLIYGKKVCPPKQIENITKDAIVIISSYQAESCKKMEKQLKIFGVYNICYGDALWLVYQIYIRNRKITFEKLAEIFFLIKYGDSQKNIFPSIDVIITERCTLRCRDCVQLISHYKHPIHYDTELISASIKKFSEIVDAVGYVRLIGGEPLLHPDIADICEKAVYDNFLNVGITTNGTVVPENDVLERLSKLPIDINISNYGELSGKINLLQEKLEAYDIDYSILSQEYEWFRVNLPKENNRSEEEKQQVYSNCRCKENQTLLNGRLYRCNYSGAIEPFHFIKNTYFDVMAEDVKPDEKKKKLRIFEEKMPFLEACEYCNMWKQIPVQRAEQVK